MRLFRPILVVLFLVAAAGSQSNAQERVTEEDYARAESFLRSYTAPLVYHGAVRPNWVGNDEFWYQNTIPEGTEYLLVNPHTGTRTRLFDHARLATTLGSATDSTFDAFQLPTARIEFSGEERTATFRVGTSSFRCDLNAYRCNPAANRDSGTDRDTIVSPDGEKAAFIRNYNLWIRNTDTGEETQLTTDGIKNFGYATNNAGWIKSDGPVLLWSPDSRKIATFQHDGRGVGEMYLVSTKVGHPDLKTWKYPLPEDSLIFRIERVVIHLDGPRVVRLNMPPDPHRSTTSDHVAGRDGTFLDVEWSPDSNELAFVSSSRDHKNATLRVADPETGAVRDVLSERVETYFESGVRMSNWHFLPASNEAIWYSERDDWGHLYMYDLTDGTLKYQITRGDWIVLQLLRIDRENRVLYFTGQGREPGDPYFQKLYRVGMDGKDLTLLTPEPMNHMVSLSPSGAYFVDSYSTPTTPPVTVLRSADGSTVLTLEEADITALVGAGWKAPKPFSVKARDGETDLYGLMYTPTNFDPAKKYPIVNYLYPGPQSGSVGTRSFIPTRGDKQSIAELGFVVVEVDAMGTPGRSKSFHDAYYGNMGDNGLPDQITMIKQLASRNAWMDIDRVGIYGHSGGGFASTDGILRYPDFYKVAVSGAGNHDNRNYEDDWGEKWQGLLVTNPDGTSNYDNQANQLLAGNLKGKLLIAHGTMDTNVPPSNTLLLANALIAANKDFDLLMFPNRGHGFGNEPYMLRRRWDYFVRNLLGAEPPTEYEFGKIKQPVRVSRPSG